MTTAQWKSYNELAWTESILTPPGSCADEVEAYCRVVKENAVAPVKSLLHLGCGAGVFDFTFKKHFEVTGVDLSPGTLEEARKLNPEVTYLEGDMRSFELQETFDCVAIPDSIGYMTTVEDLENALRTAGKHLRPGGILLIVAHTGEEFRENNFAYSGSRGEIDITVFENNFIPDPEGTTYEATIVYLIRTRGRLETAVESHTLGVFKLAVWRRLLGELDFRVAELRMDHLYDDFLLGAGEYRMTMFVCGKPIR